MKCHLPGLRSQYSNANAHDDSSPSIVVAIFQTTERQRRCLYVKSFKLHSNHPDINLNVLPFNGERCEWYQSRGEATSSLATRPQNHVPTFRSSTWILDKRDGSLSLSLSLSLDEAYASIPSDPVIIVEIETRGRSESSHYSRAQSWENFRPARYDLSARGRKRPRSLGRGGNTREKLLWGNNRAMAAESPRSNRRRIRCHVTFLYIRGGTDASRVFWTVPFGGGEPVEGGFPFDLATRARGSRRCLLLSRAARNQAAFIERHFNEETN